MDFDVRNLTSLLSSGKERMKDVRDYGRNVAGSVQDWRRSPMSRSVREYPGPDWSDAFLWFAGGVALGFIIARLWANNQELTERLRQVTADARQSAGQGFDAARAKAQEWATSARQGLGAIVPQRGGAREGQEGPEPTDTAVA